MLNLFKAYTRLFRAQKTFNKVIALNRQGDNQQALQLGKELLKEYPFDVQMRNRVARIQQELKLPIDLPLTAYERSLQEPEKHSSNNSPG